MPQDNGRNNDKQRHPISLKVIFALAMLCLMPIVITACSSNDNPMEIKLDFYWHELYRHEYNSETGKEYLVLQRVEPEDPETHSSPNTYIWLDAENFQVVQEIETPSQTGPGKFYDEQSEEDQPYYDRLYDVDPRLFPFWEDDMSLDSIEDSPDGSKAVIRVKKTITYNNGSPGVEYFYYLQESDAYSPIERKSFLDLRALTWATDTVLYSTRNLHSVLDIYDTATHQWISALPEDSEFYSDSHPEWINDHEFLIVLYDKDRGYAARIDYLTQSIITKLPLTGEGTRYSSIRVAIWSDKDIGVLWYQPWMKVSLNNVFRIFTNTDASLHRIDLGIVPE